MYHRVGDLAQAPKQKNQRRRGSKVHCGEYLLVLAPQYFFCKFCGTKTKTKMKKKFEKNVSKDFICGEQDSGKRKRTWFIKKIDSIFAKNLC